MVLSRQFNNSWSLLLQTINKVSDAQWDHYISFDPDNFWIYSLTIYHILETTEFYMRDSPDGMIWGKKGQIDWGNKLPLQTKITHLTKPFIKQYLGEIKEKMTSLFTLTQEDQLFATDGFSHFPSVLDKYLYLLRHNMMHIGELNLFLRQSKHPRINWE